MQKESFFAMKSLIARPYLDCRFNFRGRSGEAAKLVKLPAQVVCTRACWMCDVVTQHDSGWYRYLNHYL